MILGSDKVEQPESSVAKLSRPSKPSNVSLASTTASEESVLEVERRVRFHSIQVREYNRTVGDHPEVIRGAPMALDWDFHEHDHVCLSHYEENRSAKKAYLRMDSFTRKKMLMGEFDISLEELEAAEKEAQRIKDEREESKNEGDSIRQKFPKKKGQQAPKQTKGKGLMRIFKRSSTM